MAKEDAEFKRLSTQMSGPKLTAFYLSALVGAVNRNTDAIERVMKGQVKDAGKWQSIQIETLKDGLAEVAKAIREKQPPPPPATNRLEVLMSFVVKADQADVAYSLTLGEVTDSEGNVIPDAELSIEISSDNAASVEVTPEGDSRSGNVHFGVPGNATITANVKDAQGDLLGTGVAGFVVTVGDPAAITGVGLTFEGLTEAPETPEA